MVQHLHAMRVMLDLENDLVARELQPQVETPNAREKSHRLHCNVPVVEESPMTGCNGNSERSGSVIRTPQRPKDSSCTIEEVILRSEKILKSCSLRKRRKRVGHTIHGSCRWVGC